MSQAASITIGSKIRVSRVRDRIPQNLVNLLKADPSGTVTDFRTVDGKGIGVVVELSNGSTCWFFEDEIVPA
ncbi:hypothetical protein KR100_12040 [Synechococcus sp. KORDI-100]|uniref:cytochrome b6f subunit PetP n=1 Tax=Synechococcus sp. KORDI-100 TaxID=1280380 RepID=UPI0004E05288|nr:DUF2862 domain-containing protein [Synechococcus sp. KORDI-100]AII44080.1 hypothetical protein KR100_12040 [Synechococcus sp. KORDI-100]